MATISGLQTQIRGFINHPRKQYQLLNDLNAWNMLCSSLDVIEDTQLALLAYRGWKESGSDGEKYLMIFGVMQVLFVQQDAVTHLHEALDLDYDPDPFLEDVIREIRNDTVGHPTKRGWKNNRSYNFISRPTLSKEGFDLMRTFPDGSDPEFESVAVLELIRKQQQSLEEALSKAVDELRKQEAEHREKHRDEKLQDIFPQTLRYHFGKVHEAILGNRPVPMAQADLSQIAGCVDSFKDALEERDIMGAYIGIEHTLKDLEYPIGELEDYFSNPENSYLNDRSAGIFCTYTQAKMDELIEMAKEIDETYEEEP